jgi:PAS domain S-box-containing protein
MPAVTLEDWKAWFEAALETSPIGMGVISSVENRYVLVNAQLADLFGLTIDEVLATDPYSLAQRVTHPDEMVAEQTLFAELAVGARSFYRIEKRVCRPDGATRWARATLSGILGDAADSSTQVRPLLFVVVQMVDITEQRMAAEALQRREAELRHAQKIDGIGRLAAGIAHDFNNLITVILGNAQVLKDALSSKAAPAGPTSRDVDEGLDGILAACTRAASLTAQVLAHGRRQTVAPRTFALSDAVAQLQQLLGRTIGSDVRVEQALDAEGHLFADQGQVGQVVMNLMLNARDAVAEGGRIRLSTRDLTVPADAPRSSRPGPGAWVVLEVSDDGHGMPPEVQARIFEPFFTTRTDRPGTQGTGLGLSTVQRIVTEAGGEIAVSSAPGRGTTVTVFFRRVSSAPAKASMPEAPSRAEHAPNTRRVLVVEDEPSVRSLIANVLLGAHYLVAVARDGLDALRVVEAENERFDLIVTDIVMPNLSGVGLALRLSERGIASRVLFISGYSDHAPSELATMGGVLEKPFTPAQLLDSVRAALDDDRAVAHALLD